SKRWGAPAPKRVFHKQQYLQRRVRYAGTYGSCCSGNSYISQGSPNSWTTTVYNSNSYSGTMPSSSHSMVFSQGLTGKSCARCSNSYFTYNSGSSHTGFGSSDDKSLSTNAKEELQTSSNSPSSNSWKSSSSCASCSMGTGSGTLSYVQNTNPSLATSGFFSSSSSSSSFSSSSSSSSSSSWFSTYSDSQSNSGQSGFQSSSAASSQSGSSANEAQTVQTQNNNGNPPLLSTGQNTPELYSCTTCSSGVESPTSSDVKEVIPTPNSGPSWAQARSKSTSCLKCSQGNSDTNNTSSSAGFESEKTGNKFEAADSKSDMADIKSSSYARPTIIEQKDAVESELEKEVPLPPTDEELIATSCTMCSGVPSTGYYSNVEVPTSAPSLSCSICSQKATSADTFAPSVDYKFEATRAVPQTEVEPSSKKWEYVYDKVQSILKSFE
ncbi:hypothetical protein OSTOST_25407, partial [Ostertagia ostertagi]